MQESNVAAIENNNRTVYQIQFLSVIIVILIFSYPINQLDGLLGGSLNSVSHEPKDSGTKEPIITGLSSEKVKQGEELIIHGENLGDLTGLIWLTNSIKPKLNDENWTNSKVSFTIPEYIIPGEYEISFFSAGDTHGDTGRLYHQANWKTSNKVNVVLNAYEYIVQPGDSLFKIAKEKLGAEGRYLELLRINEHLFQNTHKLEVGMSILVPN